MDKLGLARAGVVVGLGYLIVGNGQPQPPELLQPQEPSGPANAQPLGQLLGWPGGAPAEQGIYPFKLFFGGIKRHKASRLSVDGQKYHFYNDSKIFSKTLAGQNLGPTKPQNQKRAIFGHRRGFFGRAG
jgi:hypothetical protein